MALKEGFDVDDFKRRMEIYGMDESSIRYEKLYVERDTKIVLSTQKRDKSFVEPLVLRTSDLDTLKRWVGLPDKLFEQHERCALKCPPVPTNWLPPGIADDVTKGDEPQQKLSARHHEAIGRATYAYLRGPSSAVARYKKNIELHFKEFLVPLWLFREVIVEPGAVLHFGAGMHTLLASKVWVKDGGKISSSGDLTVNCSLLQGA
jgi:hypothetical protein